jgi:hypothetical protein
MPTGLNMKGKMNLWFFKCGVCARNKNSVTRWRQAGRIGRDALPGVGGF